MLTLQNLYFFTAPDALFKPRSKQVPTPTKKQADVTGISPAKTYIQTLASLSSSRPATNNSHDKVRIDEQIKTSTGTEIRNPQKKKHADQDSEAEAPEAEELSSVMEGRQLRKRPQVAAADQGSPNKIGRLEKAEHIEVPKYSKEEEVKKTEKDKLDLVLGKEDSACQESENAVEPRHLRKRQQREIDQASPSKSKRTAIVKTKPDEMMKSSNTQKADERSPSKIHSIEKESRSVCRKNTNPEKAKEGTNKDKVLNDCERPKSVEKQGNNPKELGSHHSSKEHDLKSITNCSNNNSSSSKSDMDSELSRLERKRRLDIVLRRIDNSDDSSSETNETHEGEKCENLKTGDRKSKQNKSGDIDKKENHHKGSQAAGVDTEADEDMDSFDTMLAGLAKEDIKSKTSSNKSNQDRENCGNKKQTSRSSGPVNNAVVDEVRITRAGQKANQQTCKGNVL